MTRRSRLSTPCAQPQHSEGCRARDSEWYRRCASCSVLSTEEQETIESDYLTTFGKPLSADFSPSCPNRFSDAAAQLAAYYYRETESGGYALKRGVAFLYNGKIYTWKNLTEEAAQYYLNLDPENGRNFIRIGIIDKKRQI